MHVEFYLAEKIYNITRYHLLSLLTKMLSACYKDFNSEI